MLFYFFIYNNLYIIKWRQNLGQKHGFKESSAMSDQSKSFFNLGPHNDWRNLLDKKTSEKICEYFENEMKELGYI